MKMIMTWSTGPWFRFRHTPKVCYEYRRDPVPGIHNFKSYADRFYRNFSNMAEKKAWIAAEVELKEMGLTISRRRSPSSIPDAWDDYPHARIGKGWKRSKKRKQWM